MFKDLKFVKYTSMPVHKYIYEIIDDDFIVETMCSLTASCYNDVEIRAIGDVVLKEEYERRNLPFINPIAQYYFNHTNQLAGKGENAMYWLEYNKKYIDAFYPEIEYGLKIYPVVKQKLQTLLLLQ